jgi:hypothetical protein
MVYGSQVADALSTSRRILPPVNHLGGPRRHSPPNGVPRRKRITHLVVGEQLRDIVISGHINNGFTCRNMILYELDGGRRYRCRPEGYGYDWDPSLEEIDLGETDLGYDAEDE